MKLVWMLASTAPLAVGLAGCSEDDTGPGTGGTGGEVGAVTGGAGPGGDGPGGAGGALDSACDPQGDGACENETDCPFVASGQLQSTAYQCGEVCGGDGEPEACAVDCVAMELGSSRACSTCYAELVGCTNNACFVDCSAEPSSDVCKRCLEENACAGELEACGGITIE